MASRLIFSVHGRVSVARSLGGSRADIGHVVLEGLALRNAVIVATKEARGEARNGSRRAHEDQRFASHDSSPIFWLLAPGSAKRRKAAAKGTGFDHVSQDLALALVEGVVDLGEGIERALTSPVD